VRIYVFHTNRRKNDLIPVTLLKFTNGQGNYEACPVNPCENEGQCLVQSVSTINLQESEVEENGFFEIGQNGLDWFRAKE